MLYSKTNEGYSLSNSLVSKPPHFCWVVLEIWSFQNNTFSLQVHPPEVFLEILDYSHENTCTRVSVLIKLQASTFNFIKKEALAQMFSCEIREISKDTFFTAHLRATASVYTLIYIDKEFEFSSEILQSI